MSTIRPRTVVVGLAAVLGVGALVVLVDSDGTRPASPPPETVGVEYVGCRYEVPSGEVGRRLAAGEDPATLPGVKAICTSSGLLSPSASGSSNAPVNHDDARPPTPR